MAKTKQPAQALDTGKLQQLLQKLAQYGPGLLAVLQRLADVLQSKQGTGTPAGAGASYSGGVVQRAIDHQVAGLAELVYLRDALDAEGGGEEAPKAGQQAAPQPQAGQQGATTQPPKP